MARIKDLVARMALVNNSIAISVVDSGACFRQKVSVMMGKNYVQRS